MPLLLLLFGMSLFPSCSGNVWNNQGLHLNRSGMDLLYFELLSHEPGGSWKHWFVCPAYEVFWRIKEVTFSAP